jgi:hypothetical protein
MEFPRWLHFEAVDFDDGDWIRVDIAVTFRRRVTRWNG